MTRRSKAARLLALDISPLRDSPAYRALWIGQVVSLFGTQMRYVAVVWQVFEHTGSSLAVGLVGLAELVPLVTFSFIGGAVADARDRRAVIAGASVGLMATSAALALVALADRPSLLWIYGLTALASALGAFDRPARTALVPSLVASEQMASAMALRQVVIQMTQIVGPAVGGVVIASLGVAWAYSIDAATFIAAVVALRWVPTLAPHEDAVGSGLERIKEGMSFSFRKPLILSIFVVDLVAMVFGMPRAVFPALATGSFHMGAEGVGLLYAAPSVGALLGALTSGWVRRVRRQGMAVLAAVCAWGVCITLAGLSLGFLAATLVLLAFAGAADVVSAIFRGTMLQESTPDFLRGRVSAVQLMVVTGGPRLGDIEAGAAAAILGAPASVVVGGLACLLGTAAVAAAFPAMRAYEARPPQA